MKQDRVAGPSAVFEGLLAAKISEHYSADVVLSFDSGYIRAPSASAPSLLLLAKSCRIFLEQGELNTQFFRKHNIPQYEESKKDNDLNT
jgi:hypothetical protein